MPYPSYIMPYGLPTSDNSSLQSQTNASNDDSNEESRAMPGSYYELQNLQRPPPDPYGWHVSQYVQNYMGEQSFNEYSSQYTHDSAQRDEENSVNFEPHRSSMWF